MPKPLAIIKEDMLFNQNLTEVVDAMKGIAAAQYFMFEHKVTNTDDFSAPIEELFAAYDFRRSKHPFIRARSKKKLICVITTDGGFLGGLNMKAIQAALQHQSKDSYYLVLGDRGANYLKEYNIECQTLPEIKTDDSRFDLVEKTIKAIMRFIKDKGVGQVIMVHPYSLSFIQQRIDVLNLIPCPMFFKNRSANVPSEQEQAKKVILESPENGIIESLTVLWMRKRLIEVFETSKLSEFGARTMHLESSYATLTKLEKQIKLEFFKARRAKIDQSIRESFTSQIMCKD